MKKYDFIGISEQTIVGVKNPLLLIQGSILLDDYDFIVYADTEEIKFELLNLGENNFLIRAELPISTKNVKVFIKYGDKLKLISSLNNKFLGRLYRKIKAILKRIFSKMKIVFRAIFKGIKFLWREHHFLIPPKLWKKYMKDFIYKIKYSGTNLFYNPFIKEEYLKWIDESEETTVYEDLKYKPLISILIPVYNISEKLLSECLDSILNQKYQNFEICLADDCSPKEETKIALKKYEEKDNRVKVVYRKQNGHISAATNSALEIASGEFVALMDNDDIITENALYEMVKVLNQDKSIDMIYSDEDKLDLNGKRCDPNFKSDFAPDSLLSSNYICHFTMLRKDIVNQIGGFRSEYDGAQDYDLFLRFTEKTNKIYHISKILYHWRMIPGSTSMSIDNKNYAIEKGANALKDALKRRNIKGNVLIHPNVPYYMIEYKYDREPLISIIIPTRDYAEVLRECLESIYDKTKYQNFEVVIANNNSEKKDTFELFEEYKNKYNNFKVIDINTEFNYSYINNTTVKKCKGEYIVLLNNDTKVITDGWLTTMVGYAMQDHIGAVGPKLLYPDFTVQHGGVVLGLGGVASHAGLGCDRENYGIYGRLSVPYNYSAVTAACLMISRNKYEEVNGLNEELKVAYNDVDFNIKLLKKGYYNVCVPNVELIHFESKSRGLDTTSEKYKRFIKESNYMFDKWEDAIKQDPFYNSNLSKKNWFMLDKKKKEK